VAVNARGRAPPTDALAVSEQLFLREILLALGRRPDLRLWRQNVGHLPVRDPAGHVVRVFRAGPPRGAADLSGIVRPEGWRLEIEVKAARGRPSPAQVRWGSFITASGGVYLLLQYHEDSPLETTVRAAVRAVDAALEARKARP
jgi:hypothetical protein